MKHFRAFQPILSIGLSLFVLAGIGCDKKESAPPLRKKLETEISRYRDRIRAKQTPAPQRLSSDTAEFDIALKDTGDNEYITVFYPLSHILPHEANRIIAPQRSFIGKTRVAAESNSLILSDKAEFVKSMIKTLRLADQPVPQVLIEARILEVTWRKNERFGFNWGFKGTQDTETFLDGTIHPGDAGNGPVNSGLSAVFGRLTPDSMRNFTLQLDMLSGKDRVNLLASPRILVMNNKWAKFHAGSKIPVRKINVLDTKSTTSSRKVSRDYQDTYDDIWDNDREDKDDYTDDISNQSDSTHTHVSQQYIETGISLSVTPRIINRKEIILNLSPSVSEITGWRTGTEMPMMSTRNMSTTVRVKDGDTILIAGLFKESDAGSTKGVPGLRRIPGAGELFKSRNRSRTKTEVIFLLKTRLILPESPTTKNLPLKPSKPVRNDEPPEFAP